MTSVVAARFELPRISGRSLMAAPEGKNASIAVLNIIAGLLLLPVLVLLLRQQGAGPGA